ncbi:MAG TPA: alpha/beta hydrolase-fold protein [Deinococcales bacterium]|nr:alpha/beta hydrolase-fold protein [Deinococcales bacterium]
MPLVLHGCHATFTAPDGAAALIGDFTDWRERPIPLRPGESVTVDLPRAAFLEYAFLDAHGKGLADEANPVRSINPWHSYPRGAVTPGYEPSPWLEPRAGVPGGRLERLAWDSGVFAGETRRALVYTPPAFDPDRAYPAVYVQDGVAFARTGKLGTVLDNLIAAGEARESVLVFLEPRDRATEYHLNDRYLEFLTSEVIPRLEARYPLVPGRESRFLWGASLGGLISLYAAWSQPGLCGAVVAQAAALTAEPRGDSVRGAPEWLRERWAERPPEDLPVHLQCGSLDWLVGANRRFAATLFDLGARHEYRERPGGHNWVTWRDGLADGLRFLLGT